MLDPCPLTSSPEPSPSRRQVLASSISPAIFSPVSRSPMHKHNKGGAPTAKKCISFRVDSKTPLSHSRFQHKTSLPHRPSSLRSRAASIVPPPAAPHPVLRDTLQTSRRKTPRKSVWSNVDLCLMLLPPPTSDALCPASGCSLGHKTV